MWFRGLEDGEAMLGNGREEEIWAVGGSQEKDVITSYGTQTLKLGVLKRGSSLPAIFANGDISLHQIYKLRGRERMR
jgi:hypothetical protein